MLIAFYKNLEGQVVTMSDNKIRIDNFEAKEWFSSRKWGMFNHFLNLEPSRWRAFGKEYKDYNERVKAFDVSRYAKLANELNAGYVVFTITQLQSISEGDIIFCAYGQDKKITHMLMFYDYDNPAFGISDIAKYKINYGSDARFVAGYAVERDDAIVGLSTVAPNGKIDEFAHFHGYEAVVISFTFAGWAKEFMIYKNGLK